MKKLALFLTIALFFSSCGELNEMTKFSLDYETTFTIPGTIATGSPLNLKTPVIQTNTSQHFSEYNTEEGLVEEIILSQLNLTIQSPTTGDFSFLNEIKVFIMADGMRKTLIASKTNIPEDVGNTLEVEPEDVNLMEYLFKDTYQLEISVTSDETIKEDYEIGLYTEFVVDAQLI